ncbi:MAG: helix-turn-helix transcriptional regulator, partial [Clostridia bacterium]|nr:helix-turn-helix transcriptional regulator [Clostridia bacterium]
DISKGCYYEWLSGKRQATLENVIKLADRFDCRVDFILGREI